MPLLQLTGPILNMVPIVGQVASIAQPLLKALMPGDPTIFRARGTGVSGPTGQILWDIGTQTFQAPIRKGSALYVPIPVAPLPETTPTAPSAGGVPTTNGALPMSLLGDIGRAVLPGVGAILGGHFPSIGAAGGQMIGSQLAQISASRSGVSGGVQTAAFPALGPLIQGGARMLGGAAGVVLGAGILGARTIARSAIVYCRRHPAWCAQIGGTAAIASMIQSGQLPPIRRRRARGITPSEFRGFRRVHNVLSTFCAPRMRVRRKR